eukprot:CAMPEP_0185748130 /NCGR_PEP_ID=MMETSP1174-20130828/6798_1 /TAXON_ID=35687 /ORGANISM="Dictyocha speculum, Strain CCMP1381" /LENGTH=48 /DNA_ID= /DNA_START= /DNA_END= /DNA_ORIENTATION=
MPLVGSFLRPLHRSHMVLCQTLAILVHHTKVGLRNSVPLVGSFTVQLH